MPYFGALADPVPLLLDLVGPRDGSYNDKSFSVEIHISECNEQRRRILNRSGCVPVFGVSAIE